MSTRGGSTIGASVGAGGTNHAPDVRVVQDLLNRAAQSGLAVDGDCGSQTRAAIVEFQKGFLTRPDGLVEPGGQTLRRLAAGAKDTGGHGDRPASQGGSSTPTGGPTTGTRLQALGGASRGWYAYSSADRQHGTDTLCRTLLDVAAALHRAGLEYGIGDLSLAQGGAMPPHKTHTAGRHADLRPLRRDGSRGPTSIGDPSYGRDATRTLVEALRASSEITQILFNDTEIAGVKSWPGHHNHLHIQVR